MGILAALLLRKQAVMRVLVGNLWWSNGAASFGMLTRLGGMYLIPATLRSIACLIV
jgi:hypothetical protein